jgi:hypothetical protein
MPHATFSFRCTIKGRNGMLHHPMGGDSNRELRFGKMRLPRDQPQRLGIPDVRPGFPNLTSLEVLCSTALVFIQLSTP